MLIERLKTKYNVNEPIFAGEILEMFKDYSRAYVFRLIDKAEKNNEIIKFDTGTYYIPTKNIIGTSTITAEKVVNKKYVSYKNNIYGIYCGLYLQNMFSITTQMPNTIEVVSNNEATRCRKINVDGRCIILHKSRCTIDKNNVAAYTILQLLSEIKDPNNISDIAKCTISQYIKDNEISDKKILQLASFFPAKTIRNLMMSGVLNVFTQ